MPKFNGLTEIDFESLVLEHSAYHSNLLMDLIDQKMKGKIDDDQFRLEMKIITDRAMIQTIVKAVNMNTEYLLGYLKAAETDPNLR